MKIEQIYTHSHLRNFSYLLSDEQGRAYCLDPFASEQIEKPLRERSLELVAIINTHEHFDHICGNEQLQKATGCEIWAHENARGKIPGVTRYLEVGEKIELCENWHWRVMDTPGHTFAHLCLLLISGNSPETQRPEAVFTGDTLFNAGVGNCHNGGDPEVLYQTIAEQFQELADTVKVYPGHDYLKNNLAFTLDREPDNTHAKELLKEREKTSESENDFLVTNMQLERQINTFLRLDSKSIRQHLELADGEGAANKDVFLELRKLRNHW